MPKGTKLPLFKTCCLKTSGREGGSFVFMKMSTFYGPFLGYLKTKGMCEKTISEYDRMLYGSLSESIQDIELQNLRMVDVALVEEAGRGHGEYGAQRAVVVFRRLLCFIRDTGLKLPFDWRDVKLPKAPDRPTHSLSESELDQLFDSFNLSDIAHLRTRALLEVMLDTGMRIGEACSLNRNEIDWENKEVEITNCKTKKRELVYFTDRSLYWVKRYLDRRKDDMEALFLSGRGRLLPSTANNFLRVHTAGLGIKKHVHHHLFRKTFVTELLRRGVDIKSVQALARHRSERTTLKHYAAVDVGRCKGLHQKVMSEYRAEEVRG